MKRNRENEKLGIKERGPVWRVKMEIDSEVRVSTMRLLESTKILKMKVILN